ncbi:hypothetical protein HOP50_03g20460 [Chloropicon primus]|nr:hypothetical protein HOP50_03g20460 [Chloropicon primus]
MASSKRPPSERPRRRGGNRSRSPVPLLVAVLGAVFLGLATHLGSKVVPDECRSPRDWQCFSGPRRERLLDPTFAGFVARASFAAIVEDSSVGGVKSGETDKAVARELLGRVNELYSLAAHDLGLEPPPPPRVDDDDGDEEEDGGSLFPSNEDLRQPEVFDAYSYAQFAAAAEILEGRRERRGLTERAGQRILSMMRELAGVDPSGDPSDLREMQQSLDKVLDAFVRVGYVLDSGLIWPQNAEEIYERTGELTFQYWMKDPVILPSARKLFTEQGFAQHFSSRTIESLFAGYMVEAREDDDFDPREYPDDRVVEQWTLKALA